MEAVSRRFLASLGLITAAAAAWRIWYVVDVVNPRIRKLGLSDELFYHLQARFVADGLGFVNPFAQFFEHRSIPTAIHPPLYTVFLSFPAKLGLDTILEQRIFTALLGAGTVFLIGILGRRLVSPRVGLIAAGIAAVSPALWVNDAVIGLETLYAFLVVLALLATYRFWDRPTLPNALLLGLWLALATITRSEGLILAVLIAIPTVVLVRGVDTRRKLQFLGAIAAVGLVVVGPWVIRNLTTFERTTTLGTGFGGVLAYGNCDATYGGPMLGFWDDSCSLKGYPKFQEESVVDGHARQKGWDYVSNHLRRLPVVVAARVGRVWGLFRPVQDVEFNEVFERRGHDASWAVMIGYFALLPFSIGGLVVMRRRRIPIFPMLAVAASITITVALSFSITRYRAAFDAVMPVLAAIAIDALLRWRAQHRHADEPAPAVAAHERKAPEIVPL